MLLYSRKIFHNPVQHISKYVYILLCDIDQFHEEQFGFLGRNQANHLTIVISEETEIFAHPDVSCCRSTATYMSLINEAGAFIQPDFCGVIFLRVFYEHIAISHPKVTLVSRELVIGTTFSSRMKVIFHHVVPNMMWCSPPLVSLRRIYGVNCPLFNV
jgi:hypothetical protein